MIARLVTPYPHLLWKHAEQNPDATAFVFLDEDGTESAVNYLELYAAARGVAEALRTTARGRPEPVLLLLPPGLEYVTGLFGCLLSGLPAVPAFPPDPYRLERSMLRLGTILRDSTARIVLTTEEVVAGCGDLIREAAGDEGLEFLVCDRLGRSSDPPLDLPDPHAPALLQYTSGSTSLPRGVVVTQANISANCEYIRRAFAMDRSTVGASWLPPYHDMGLVGFILEPVYTGIKTILMPPTMFIRKPIEWLRAIGRHRADVAGGPNFGYDLCVRRVKPEARAELDLSSWDLAFSGAEPVRAGTLAAFADAFGECGFKRRAFYPCYGLAEATLLVTGGTRTQSPRVLPMAREPLATDGVAMSANGGSRQELVSVGSPDPDHELAIVEADSGTVLAEDQVGEIWLRGPSVAAGYWRREPETVETFGAVTADGRGPFLRTGDLGFMHDGELFVTGRIKDVVIVNGRNIYPTEVEWACESAVPRLRPGCGAAFGISPGGGDERMVVVYEVREGNEDVLAGILDSLRRAVGKEVSSEPEAIVLVEPRSIAKTSSGKVQRWLVRQHYMEDRLATVAAWSRSKREPTLGVAAEGASR